ncbi:MAG: hypothetical protein PSV16_15100 [Flavobacterium sp.]|nr:hypothetical protein [Flavobacterium sp.]
MTEKKKQYIIKNLKWPIGFTGYLWNYFSLFVPAVLLSIVPTEYDRGRPIAGLIFISLFLIFLIIYGVETERTFKKLTLTKDWSTSEIAKILEKNTFSFVNQTDGVLEIGTRISAFSWGEKITIIKVTKDLILINTQPTGRGFISFKNKANYNKIKAILAAVK